MEAFDLVFEILAVFATVLTLPLVSSFFGEFALSKSSIPKDISKFGLNQVYINLPNTINSTFKIYKLLKRFFDIIFSVLFLVFLLPVIFNIYILLKLESFGAPVFIKVNKKTIFGDEFTILKFRTMSLKTVSSVVHMEHELSYSEQSETKVNHVTKVGGLLRRLRLDELPILISLLKGHVSIIGLHTIHEGVNVGLIKDKIIDVNFTVKARPGILDIYSILNPKYFLIGHGIYDLESVEMQKYELLFALNHEYYYVSNCGFLFDLKLLVLAFFTQLNIKNYNQNTSELIKIRVAFLNSLIEKKASFQKNIELNL
jgi:lipopolysaccharide/colanic/teichoic acid biosynthesis glycosyltransferase